MDVGIVYIIQQGVQMTAKDGRVEGDCGTVSIGYTRVVVASMFPCTYIYLTETQHILSSIRQGPCMKILQSMLGYDSGIKEQT